MSLFRCPVCAAPLCREGGALRCTNRHSFDLAREGYVNLLPPNRKHSKDPGDDRDMVAARSAFLERGYYLPLRRALETLSCRLTQGTPAPVAVDSGCGEGWYTAGVASALTAAGRPPRTAGVDISRFALRRAARRLPEGEFAVLLLDVFSPLAAEEFARVVRPGGHFLYVVPSARHLWQMKEILYPEPYENPVKAEDYPGFTRLGAERVRETVTLDRNEDIMALFRMTPYAWKTPREGAARLERRKELTCEIGFDIHIYRRE